MEIETQKAANWCWAAVTVSVDRELNPSSDLTQCRVAQAVFGSQDCCASMSACDQPQPLQVALSKVNRLRDTIPDIVGFDRIRAEIRDGRPVCLRIKWRGSGAHFVVIDKFDRLETGEIVVHVLDPLYPNSRMFLDDLVSAYLGDGEWVATFLVK
jgi:hypothetical protein